MRAHDGSVAGFEALLRWERPDGTIIPPNDFIPIAEETGLIVSIGDWIIDQACEQLRAWNREAINAPWISVNVSAMQLGHHRLQRSLRRALEQSGADPRRLVIELTESAFVTDEETNTAELDQLRRMGVPEIDLPRRMLYYLCAAMPLM